LLLFDHQRGPVVAPFLAGGIVRRGRIERMGEVGGGRASMSFVGLAIRGKRVANFLRDYSVPEERVRSPPVCELCELFAN
jgi:hypothetical protein